MDGVMNWLLFYVQHVDGPKFSLLHLCIGYGRRGVLGFY